MGMVGGNEEHKRTAKSWTGGMLMGKAEMFEDNTPMFVMGVNQEKYTKD